MVFFCLYFEWQRFLIFLSLEQSIFWFCKNLPFESYYSCSFLDRNSFRKIYKIFTSENFSLSTYLQFIYLFIHDIFYLVDFISWDCKKYSNKTIKSIHFLWAFNVLFLINCTKCIELANMYCQIIIFSERFLVFF